MILGRLFNHLKTANWQSAFIELVVVVAGVYGAFELERWGEDRRDARYEQVLLEQLHGEIVLAIPMMEEQLLGFAETQTGVQQAATILMQDTGSEELDSSQCDSLFRVSILRYTPLTLTSLEEMATSGIHSELDDQELKVLLFILQRNTRDLSSFNQLVLPQQRILMDMYPELIPRGIDSNGAHFMNCDTDGMRINQGFINHMMSDFGRYRGLSGRLGRQLETLTEIHARLDHVLEISHAE